MKITLRIYTKNPSSSRTVTLEEGEIIDAFKALLLINGQIDTEVACDISIDETTI